METVSLLLRGPRKSALLQYYSLGDLHYLRDEPAGQEQGLTRGSEVAFSWALHFYYTVT